MRTNRLLNMCCPLMRVGSCSLRSLTTKYAEKECSFGARLKLRQVHGFPWSSGRSSEKHFTAEGKSRDKLTAKLARRCYI
jgi:hypothetical protein